MTVFFVTGMLFAAWVSLAAARPPSVPQIIRRTFPDDQTRALCIARYESTGGWGYRPSAQNGSNTGLFQVDQRTWDPKVNPRALPIVGPVVWGRMHDPAYNARVARSIYLYEKRSGGNPWGPWSTRGMCGA